MAYQSVSIVREISLSEKDINEIKDRLIFNEQNIDNVRKKIDGIINTDNAASGDIVMKLPDIEGLPKEEPLKEEFQNEGNDALFYLLIEDIKEIRQRLSILENRKSFVDRFILYFKNCMNKIKGFKFL